ncbi:MAG: NAD-dependent epimerase/dehydratase family protein [Verrucomicrobiota bacterium]
MAHRILVTGGDGFVGSHFVERAVNDGHEVSVLDQFVDGCSKHLRSVEDRVRLIPHILDDNDSMTFMDEGFDVVYHFAWNSHPVKAWEQPEIEVQSNLPILLHLSRRAAASGVRKLVFASSGGTVYGTREGLIDERVVPRPFNPYGIGKLTAEHLLYYVQQRYGIATDVYRIANAYGPRQDPDRQQGVIAVWMDRVRKGETLQVFGDDQTLRDYVHVEDIAYLMSHSLRDLRHSDTYNLGTGRGVSVLQLIDLFKAVVDVNIDFNIAARRDLDNASAVLDAQKLLSHFPGFAFQTLEASLPKLWRQESDDG